MIVMSYDNVYLFAAGAHLGQVRDFTGEPYITHPLAVAEIIKQHGGSDLEIFGALLHDTIEDSKGVVTRETIANLWGEELATIVWFTTKISKKEDGNRATRVAMDIAHYAQGPAESQNIKIADFLHNLPEMVKSNPEFAKKYLKEKEALLKELKKAKPSLRLAATELINTLKQELYK